MPTLDWNKQTWGHRHHWSRDGHEWSVPWGSAGDQWVNTIYPRIFTLLPAESILEIAPGRGRWTSYLLNYTAHYTGIDIAEPLVAHLQRIFGPLPMRPKFLLGDGFKLHPIPDNSIGLVFSFDSLVHVELETIASYAFEIARVLMPGGYAFIHHSNLGEYVQNGKLNITGVSGGRGVTVTAEAASAAFREAGLVPLVHEKIQWQPLPYYGDCLSLVRKPAPGEAANGGPETPLSIFYNEGFQAEMRRSKLLSSHYTAAVR